MLKNVSVPMALRSLVGAIALSTMAVTALAQAADPTVPKWARPVIPWPTVTSSVKQAINANLADASVKASMNALQADEARTLQETITLSEIAAPPFGEEKKAQAYMEMLKQSGLSDVSMDKEGNVIGVRKGSGKGPSVVVDAHLDTVFPATTDLKVREKDGKYFGPGITDDTRALAVMLSWVRALKSANVNTVGDLIFVGSVGEEGNGDLRGMRAFFKEHTNIDAMLGLEATPVGVVSPLNTGSIRYEVKYSAPGGHSYGAFGEVPSAIHAMGRAIAMIADINAPKVPRTTYNVGIVDGGRSVNTISPDATMEVDMRSDGVNELKAIEKKILAMIEKSVVLENKRFGGQALTVSIKKIGERPGGLTPSAHPLIQAALGSMRALGQKELMTVGLSTNAGIPLSLNIPTIIMGPGGKFEGFHAMNEAMDPKDGYKGSQIALLTALSLVGVEGVSKPVIAIRSAK
jgi:acetylornithine deacetylase/succinyl-diaminopimelate desuccinylase-like protein